MQAQSSMITTLLDAQETRNMEKQNSIRQNWYEDLDSFMQRFEDVAIEAEIPKNDWLIYFENSLTG